MILVTGASGQLGRRVVEQLVKKVPAATVVAAVRDPKKAADLAKLGVVVREADYDRPESWAAALQGVDRVLLVSAPVPGRRAQQHQVVIDAAKKAGVKQLAYTSILHADGSTMALAKEHQTTEQAIRASGVPFTFLRNGWYFENDTAQIPVALKHGYAGATAGGRTSYATRDDYAAAAVAVLTSKGHEHQVYELAGDVGLTRAELAAEVAKQTGQKVGAVDLPAADYMKVLLGAGLPPPFAELLVDADLHVAKGALEDRSGTLKKLIGRPTTPLADAVKQALARA